MQVEFKMNPKFDIDLGNIELNYLDFDNLFKHLPLSFLLINPKNDKIYKVNTHFENHFYYHQEDILYKTTSELGIWQNDTSYQEYKNSLDIVCTRGKMLEKQVILKTSRNTSLYGTLLLSPINLENEEFIFFIFQDLSSERSALNILQEASEQIKRLEFERDRFYSLVNLSEEEVFIIDATSGDIIDTNETARRNLSYKKQEIPSLKISDIEKKYPLDSPQNWSVFLKKLKTVSPDKFHFQGKHITKDQTEYPVDVIASYKNFQGKSYIVMAAKDVSLKVAVKKAMRESEARFKAIFEGSSLGIALLTLEGKFVNTNTALEQMFGYTKQELHEMNLVDICTATDCTDGYSCLQAIIDNENQYVKKDGTYIWCKNTKSILKDGNKNPTYEVLMFEDITAKKRVEKENKEHSLLLKSINEHLSEGIYRIDKQGKFVYVNQAFTRLFGFGKPEDVLGKNVMDMYGEDEKIRKLAEIVLKNKAIQNEEVLFTKQDGDTFWGLLSCYSSIQKEDDIIYYDGSVIDISEKRHKEELLEEKNTALEKINTELDRFVYSASHDLRSPLSSILGLVEVAGYENKDSNMSKYLEMIGQSVQKLDLFVKDIINYSKNSRLELKKAKIDFKQAVADTFENLQFMENMNKIEKIFLIQENLDFYSDPIRTNIILNNLISNAVKYHNLHQDNPYIQVQIHQLNQVLEIKISDNGKGIKKEYLGRVFEMFYRATEEAKGSGLGLYIIKETVQKLHGSIKIESEYTAGTAVTVRIPNLKNLSLDEL